MELRAIYSDMTCGLNCWLAKEEICRCSCWGKNHGLILKGGEPEKQIKIDGARYKLLAVGLYSEMHSQARELLKDTVHKTIQLSQQEYKYPWRCEVKGSPIRLKPIKDSQRSWAEVKNLNLARPYALWEKVEEVPHEPA